MKIPAHTLKHQLALHSWVGISSAILLTISFISGSLTVFNDDITRWASPPAPQIQPAADMAELARLMQHMAEHPEHTSSFLLYLHTDENAPAPLHWETGDSETWAYLDADGTLHSHTRPATAAGHVLDELHRSAGIPTIAGEYSMGIVAILYLLALISGTLLALPKLGQQCLALRLNHSRRRAWLDIHNLLGLTALPFHLIIAITTILFVFAAPLSTLLQPLAPPPPVAENHTIDERPLLPPQALVAAAQHEIPDLQVRFLAFDSLADREQALAVVVGEQPSGGRQLYLALHPYSGALRYRNHYARARDILHELHFGNYGGYPLRWLYFALGLGGALLFYSGNRLWLDKRARGGARRDVRILAALTEGCTYGSISGIALILLAAVGLLPFTPRLLPLVDTTALAFGIALLATARRTASATNIHTP
ncbi:MAG: PepSY-associated TM helix domain-containing protein [Cardiobacterium sp.]